MFVVHEICFELYFTRENIISDMLWVRVRVRVRVRVMHYYLGPIKYVQKQKLVKCL